MISTHKVQHLFILNSKLQILHSLISTLRLFYHLFPFFDHIINGSSIHKRLFRVFIHISIKNHLETSNRFFQRNHNPGNSRELFSHVKGLR